MAFYENMVHGVVLPTGERQAAYLTVKHMFPVSVCNFDEIVFIYFFFHRCLKKIQEKSNYSAELEELFGEQFCEVVA